MALRRVFVDRINGGEALAQGATARHLARVARLRPGERVEVSDQVRVYRAVTEACSAREVRFRIEESLPGPESAPRVDVAVAIIKFARFEWAVEKLTEIGVESIIPVAAARSDTGLVSAASKRLERWRRIAFEAAQQSRRLSAPVVGPPTSLADTVRGCGHGERILADPEGRPLAQVYGGGAATVLVGPEGGWTDSELDTARECGFEPARLGETVLRTETAAIAITAACASSQDGRESA